MPVLFHSLVAWAIFRLASWAVGVRLDTSPGSWFWQYLDLEQLRDQPLVSLWYLHAQPPGFNALLAVGQQFTRPDLFYAAAFRVFGALLAVGFARAVERLGVSRRGAIAGVWLFNALPSSLLYESFFFYSLPVAAILVWAVVAFGSTASRPRPRSLALFTALCALLVLTRSTFHWTWVLLTAGLLAARVPRGWRRYVAVSGFVVACSLLFVKNAVLFGFFGSSSWLGMSIAKHALEPLSPAQRAILVADDPPEVAHLVNAPPFATLDRYSAQLREVPPQFSNVPVLASPLKSSGSLNLNHIAYIHISDNYGKLARRAVSRYPTAYMQSVRRAVLTLANPSVEYWELLPNLAKIGRWHAFVSELGGLPPFDASEYRAFEADYLATRVSPAYMCLTLLTLVWGIRGAFSARGPAGRSSMLQFALMTIGLVTTAQILVEVGENHRIAYEVFPIGFAITVAMVDDFIRTVSRAEYARR